MEEIGSSIISGFFRGIGYLLADIFFGTICFWIGWPICKILSGGKYPPKNQRIYWSDSNNEGGWCSVVGLIVLVIFGVYFISFAN